jgi:micrococcal nuclease
MYEYKATVTKVVDGDTLVLNIDLGFGITYNNQKVRLARINTAETNTESGKTVKDILTKLLLNKVVTIKTTKDSKDKYGRYLAEVYLINELSRVDQVNINDYLLTNNYAVKYD